MQEFNKEAMLKAIKDALKSNIKNTWLEGGDFSIYIRNTKRMICEYNQGVPIRTMVDCFDFSNIVIRDPGKGHFTFLLDNFEPICSKVIYVENVTNKRFQNFLLRRGYCRNHNPGFPEMCFFKVPA